MKNKINVNISPNPLDLQTLHCSQNDTGERKFYFTLHNNGEVIDTTDISDPIFEPFDVYKGGTEQLLPVNTDDPSTSPIIADIQYPDEEKTEQEFTYRESPTTLDGKALVEKIKGNTLVWNQTVQASNIVATKTVSDVTFTNNADGSVTMFGTASALIATQIATGVTLEQNHVYYLGKGSTWSFMNGYGVDGFGLIKHNRANASNIYVYIPNGKSVNEKASVQCIDLTKMFGSTKADEIYAMDQSQSGSGVSYFRSLFPLPYYQYEQGKLLSFNGEGIKTTGKNIINADESYTFNPTLTPIPVYLEANKTYTISYEVNVAGLSLDTQLRTADNSRSIAHQPLNTVTGRRMSVTMTPTEPVYGLRFYVNGQITVSNIQIEYGSTATSYEPYKESSLSLPVSQYFPTGMKSAGTVYDELTNSKAITRIGEIDLGTLNYGYNSGNKWFYSNTPIADIKKPSATTVVVNATSKYQAYSQATLSADDTLNGMCVNSSGMVIIRDLAYTDATAFKTAMDGVMLQYELAEEQVTEFTHASLICEDGESALYHDDDLLVCECTEDFSKDSGFKDCKIKFTNDDEVVYSSKIQLHIERKP